MNDKLIKEELDLIQNLVNNYQTQEALARLQQLKQDLGDDPKEYHIYQVFMQMGLINANIGFPEKAVVCFEKAYRISKKNYSQNPSNIAWAKAWQKVHAWIGEVYILLNKSPQAHHYFIEAKKIAFNLGEKYPRDGHFAIAAAESCLSIGNMHLSLGSTSSALVCFEVYQELAEAILESHPDLQEANEMVAQTYKNFGKYYQATSELDRSLEFFTKAKNRFKNLYEKNSGDVQLKTKLGNTYLSLGSIYLAMDNPKEAEGFLLAHNEQMEELLDVDPNSVFVKKNLLSSYDIMGDLYAKQQDLPKALEFYEQCNAFCKQLRIKYPYDGYWNHSLITSLRKLSIIAEVKGDIQTAFLNMNQVCLLLIDLCYSISNTINKQMGIKLAEAQTRVADLLIKDNQYTLAASRLKSAMETYQHLHGAFKEEAFAQLADDLKYRIVRMTLNNILEKNESQPRKIKRTTKDNSLVAKLALNTAKNLSRESNFQDALKKLEQVKKDLGKLPDGHYSYEVLIETGGIQKKMGKPKKALANFSKAYNVLKRFYNQYPKDFTLASNWVVIHERLSMVYIALEDYNQALHYLHKVENLVNNLLESHSTNSFLHEIWLNTLSRFGEIYLKLGKHSSSIEYFLKCKNTAEQIIQQEPTNETYRNILMNTYLFLGECYSTSSIEQALAFFTQAKDEAKKLCEENQYESLFKIRLTNAYLGLGDTYLKQGDTKQAEKYFSAYNKKTEELAINYPDHADIKKNLSASYQKLGDVHFQNNNIDKAIEFFEKFNKVCQELHKTFPTDRDFEYNLAVSNRRLGFARAIQGNIQEAIDQILKAIKALQNLYQAPDSFSREVAIDFAENQIILADLYKTGQKRYIPAIPYLESAHGIYTKLYQVFEEDIFLQRAKNLTQQIEQDKLMSMILNR